MTKLILIRHGETDWNVEGRWQGQIDLPLNERGSDQSLEIAETLSGCEISAIYSSDLQRAIVTAQALADRVGLTVRVDPRLREINQGEWQGLLIRDIRGRYTQAFEELKGNPLMVSAPGGETTSQVRKRVIEAAQDILRRHPGETVAVVSHGYVIAVILTHYRRLPFEQVWELIPGNASWQVLELTESEVDIDPNAGTG